MQKKNEFRSRLKTLTGKRPLEKHRHRWENNIRMNLKEEGVSTRIKLIRLRIGSIGGPCQCVTEPPGSIRQGVMS